MSLWLLCCDVNKERWDGVGYAVDLCSDERETALVYLRTHMIHNTSMCQGGDEPFKENATRQNPWIPTLTSYFLPELSVYVKAQPSLPIMNMICLALIINGMSLLVLKETPLKHAAAPWLLRRLETSRIIGSLECIVTKMQFALR